MSVRSMRQNLDAAYDTLVGLKEAFSKQYWYCHPTKEGSDIPCYLCGVNGSKHIESPNGYLCPVPARANCTCPNDTELDPQCPIAFPHPWHRAEKRTNEQSK